MTGSGEMLRAAREALKKARRVAVLTGAGISAESGVPVFRGAAGLWKNFRAEELATPEAFAREPMLVWEWYDWRRGLIARAEPNEGHFALVRLEERAEQFALITQNVDGLHALAGSGRVLEIHGSIWRLRCTRCWQEWTDRRVPLALPPECRVCGAQARPGVVWFGEGLPAPVWGEAESATQACDVFLIVGTSAVVYPAAGLVDLAKRAGAKVIEINLEATAISKMVDWPLSGRAGEILPQLIAEGARDC